MLYICPTPIGNLEDITIRVLNVLKKADVIACEDTRHSKRLLSYYEIRKPLISLHEHNEKKRSEEVMSLLRSGKEVAFISDAGMPGIQDPGYFLIQTAVKEGLEYTVLPGASAAITALVASNLASKEFFFEGFLPRKAGEQKQRLKVLKGLQVPFILYEAPGRVSSTLKNALEVLGDRKIAVLRELTKIHEEYLHTTLSEYLILENKVEKGEFVLIIEGATQGEKVYLEEEIVALLKHHIEEGSSRKDAVKKAMELTGLPKNKIYPLSLDL